MTIKTFISHALSPIVMHSHRTSILMVFLSSAILCGGQQRGHFANPVIKGDLPDPTVIRVGDRFYAAGTSSEWAPFFPLFESDDLVNWNQTGHIFNTRPEWTVSSFWAPELFCHDGKIFCYYTARQKGTGISYIGVAATDAFGNSFTDHGPVVEYGTEAIDPFVFEDNGSLFISWKAYGLDKRPVELLCCKLSDDGLRMEGEPFSLLKDDENIGMEGQYQCKIGEYYYIIYSAHGCCGPESDYDVYVARSRNFMGPYEKYSGNPILHGGIGEIKSCGHGTMVTVPDGRMFYLCHAYLNGEGFFSGRQPVLHEMEVAPNGWLRVKTGSVAVIEQEAPFSGTVQNVQEVFEDSFTEKELKQEWCWNYLYSNISAKTEGGMLYLSGTPEEGNNYGTALCVRPWSPSYVCETGVVPTDSSMKGLTLYGDSNNLLIWGTDGSSIVLKIVQDGKEEIMFSTQSPGNVQLRLETDGGMPTAFWWSSDSETWTRAEGLSVDVSCLLRWDRVQRPGVIYCGKEDSQAVFTHFRIEYN